MDRSTQKDWVKCVIRLPRELKSWVEQEADHNLASQNSEIVRALVERRDRQSAMREQLKAEAAG